ncbi:45530_t:CDS:1 [Gigaspora margarita]|uniref:45530_t:CDS:1 n=1 Tax=Gigaspora margarita TaxID=4874 RepID=A0ABN7UHS8_GIGMA|nr:45530_t:CDS:1 [Gigaspora margarita]
MEKKTVKLSDQQLIVQILEVNNDIKNNPYDYEIESKKSYEYLLSRLLEKYSILSLAIKDNFAQQTVDHIETKHDYEKYLEDFSLLIGTIGSNNFYFDYQKEKKSNSLFRLLNYLKKKNDDLYERKEFDLIKSPTFFDLTEDFKNVLEVNKNSEIYYRFTSNSCITNRLSLENFRLSKKTILKDLLSCYALAKWF